MLVKELNKYKLYGKTLEDAKTYIEANITEQYNLEEKNSTATTQLLPVKTPLIILRLKNNNTVAWVDIYLPD